MKTMLSPQRRGSRNSILFVVCLLLLTTAAGAEDLDLSGTWKLTMLEKSPLGSDTADMTFEVDGHNVMTNLSVDGKSVPCMGYMDGHAIRFYYVRPSKKGETIVRFSGHIRGDLMGGEADMGNKGVTTWKATRGEEQGVDLSGTWTLQMKADSPTGLHLVKMTFRQDRDHIVALLESEEGSVECEGYVKGRSITFYYVRPSGDSQFVARFEGQLAGGIMGGEVDLGEHGKSTWRASKDI